MSKFISVVAILCMLSSLFVIYKVNQIETVVLTHEHLVEYVPNELSEIQVIARMVEPTIPEAELLCLQTNMYFEARNQGAEGMIAVAWVTFNRVKSNHFRDSICEVVYRARTNSRGQPIRNRCQFSWYCDGLKDTPNLHNKL